jgi:hypothetical protein
MEITIEVENERVAYIQIVPYGRNGYRFHYSLPDKSKGWIDLPKKWKKNTK